jgi:hypothetical protein
MLAGIDTNLVGLALIAVAVGGLLLYAVGRRRQDGRWMTRLGAVTVIAVLAGLVLVIASAALATVGD